MIEIESSEIIAYYVMQENQKEFTLSYQKIRKFANFLEDNNSQLVVCCDRISIDAFRCTFPKNVKMDDEKLTINMDNNFQDCVKRYAIKQEFQELIKKAIEQIDKE